MNTVIDRFSDDFSNHAGKKDFISGIILRYWISSLNIDKNINKHFYM